MKRKIHPSYAAAASLAVATLALSAFTGLCANAVYPAVVQGDGALGYYRFNDSSLTRTVINTNIGSLGAAGNASNDLATVTGGTVFSMPGAIVGDPDRAAFYDYTTRTEIPFNSALNTPNTQPFSVEAWLYPVSYQGSPGMGALCNRWTQTGNRQGWVMYQRGANTNAGAFSSGPGLGWEFRMYNDLDTSSHLDVQSLTPFTVGKWQHVVVVYDPVGGDPLAATLTFYIDGVFANAVTNTSGVAGYGPCTGDHVTAPNGQPAMSLGGYNNANSGTAGFANPWTGGVDEYAWYNYKLTAAQVQAHYQNGTNANRSTPYATLVKSDNPVAYLRLNEVAPGPDVDFNIGDVRSASHATNNAGVKVPGSSALTGSQSTDGSFTGRPQYTLPLQSGFADIPFTAANNPDASVPFTIEAWFRPKTDYTRNGPAPINNRLAGTTVDRTGWIIYQRDADASYATNSPSAGESGVGWALRMYQGNAHNDNDVITAGSGLTGGWGYNVGEWMHVVFTWQPVSDNGLSLSGSEQWNGIMTAYTNGVAANTNTSAFYAANVNPTEDARTPADLAIGSYNLASNPQEEFDGDIDEFALYTGFTLTPAQILAHYQAGTNAHPATNYEALVFNAGSEIFLADPANSGLLVPETYPGPRTYLRFNGPAYSPAVNSGSLGHLADGSLVLAQNNVAGPTTGGFEGSNTSVPFDGTQSWVSLNNPAGLRISGQITLEAWIKPGATQTNIARIVSHGPPTPTSYDPSVYTFDLMGTLLSSNQVFLRLEGNGATYSVGSSDGTTFHGATAPVPAGVLGGGQWVYLAGTYDGTHWNLYTNGVLASSVADATGALPVNAEWAIGSTGDGWPTINDTAGAEGTMEFFSGSIDEVAIYGTALSAGTIAAHYYVAQNGPVSISITQSTPGHVTVNFPTGTLQQSSSLNGGWTDVVGATAPSYSTTSAGAPKYYRVKL